MASFEQVTLAFQVSDAVMTSKSSCQRATMLWKRLLSQSPDAIEISSYYIYHEYVAINTLYIMFSIF